MASQVLARNSKRGLHVRLGALALTGLLTLLGAIIGGVGLALSGFVAGAIIMALVTVALIAAEARARKASRGDR